MTASCFLRGVKCALEMAHHPSGKRVVWDRVLAVNKSHVTGHSSSWSMGRNGMVTQPSGRCATITRDPTVQLPAAPSASHPPRRAESIDHRAMDSGAHGAWTPLSPWTRVDMPRSYITSQPLQEPWRHRQARPRGSIGDRPTHQHASARATPVDES